MERLKCADFADSYLCNANGSFVDGNAAYTRPKQLDRAYALAWTLRDADSEGWDAKGWRLSVSPEEDRSAVELRERELLVEENEMRLQSLEEQIASREVFQTQQAADLASRRDLLLPFAVFDINLVAFFGGDGLDIAVFQLCQTRAHGLLLLLQGGDGSLELRKRRERGMVAERSAQAFLVGFESCCGVFQARGLGLHLLQRFERGLVCFLLV